VAEEAGLTVDEARNSCCHRFYAQTLGKGRWENVYLVRLVYFVPRTKETKQTKYTNGPNSLVVATDRAGRVLDPGLCSGEIRRLSIMTQCAGGSWGRNDD
jgi:hypothetical protein